MTYLNSWKPMETYGNCHYLSIFRSKIFKKQIDFEDQHQNDLHDSMDILYIYTYTYIDILCWVGINYDLQSSSRAMNTKLLSDLLRHQTTQQ